MNVSFYIFSLGLYRGDFWTLYFNAGDFHVQFGTGWCRVAWLWIESNNAYCRFGIKNYALCWGFMSQSGNARTQFKIWRGGWQIWRLFHNTDGWYWVRKYHNDLSVLDRHTVPLMILDWLRDQYDLRTLCQGCYFLRENSLCNEPSCRNYDPSLLCPVCKMHPYDHWNEQGDGTCIACTWDESMAEFEALEYE